MINTLKSAQLCRYTAVFRKCKMSYLLRRRTVSDNTSAGRTIRSDLRNIQIGKKDATKIIIPFFYFFLIVYKSIQNIKEEKMSARESAVKTMDKSP